MHMTIKEATAVAGPLGYPSKMPGTSYGISASACKVGGILAKVPGSVCHGCYAMRGNYLFRDVKASHAKRLAGIADARWTVAMVTLLENERRKACREFMDPIHKLALQARSTKQKRSTLIGCLNQIVAAGYGWDRSTSTAMGTTQRQEAQSPATFRLTLPLSGATVALSQPDATCTTHAGIASALTRIIWKSLTAKPTSKCTPTKDATQLPEGLHLNYYFRWHDSGDLQSVEHLTKICAVAAATPHIRHWLPTREVGIVKQYVRQGGVVPDNLLIRISATMVDGAATKTWPHTSGVHTSPLGDDTPKQGHECPAPKQDGKCGDCRACWSHDVPHTSYHKH